MNHRITLLRRAAGQDTGGQLNTEFDDVATVWADVRFQSGAEVLRAGAETTIKRASIRVRTRAGLDETWRVRYQGIEFSIKSALPDVDRTFTFLVCEATR